MIKVVYHCYLVGNWKFVVREQLTRMKSSGLYDEADEIFVTVNLDKATEDEFNEVTKDFLKLQKEFFHNNNAEYPAVKKVREIGTSEECKVFYFHTKGVSNTYSRHALRDKSEEKIKNILAWRECLEYFLIDRWKECVNKLENFDNVGVTCNNGWFWGNFWWTQTKHLLKTKEVSHGTRWSYEAWLNEGSNPNNYEWFKFSYNPYITHMDPDFYNGTSKYKNDDIFLHRASYGSIPFEIDEGYSNSTLNVTNDVTEAVRTCLKNTNYKQLSITASNDVLGGDPIFGTKKFLIVDLSPKSNPEKIYKIGIHEGSTLNFQF